MEFTKEQLSELISKHSEKENGLQDLMEMMLERLMLLERKEYLNKEGLRGNKCNGFRPGRTYGYGRTLNFRIPRDRYGNFHPCILAILREQEDECERLAGSLYSKGLVQLEQIDIRRLQAGQMQRFGNRGNGTDAHNFRGTAGHRIAHKTR